MRNNPVKSRLWPGKSAVWTAKEPEIHVNHWIAGMDYNGGTFWDCLCAFNSPSWRVIGFTREGTLRGPEEGRLLQRDPCPQRTTQ